MSESSQPENPQLTVLHPTVFQEGHSSNEVAIVLADNVPVFGEAADSGDRLFSKTRIVPFGILKLSPQAAKDLLLILQQGIQQYEQEFGPIKTAYLKTLTEGKG